MGRSQHNSLSRLGGIGCALLLGLCLDSPGTWAATPVHAARPMGVSTTNQDFFNAVAYGNGLYAAVGTGGVIYSSTDGTHWTARQGGITTGGQYLDMIYANGMFLAIGLDAQFSTHATQSVDGVTWKDATIPLPVSNLFQGVGFGNGTFVVTDTVAATSPDGMNWTIHDIVPGTTSGNTFGAPVFANNTFASLGFDTSNNPLLYVSKDNGATWSSGFTFAATDNPQVVVSNGSSFVVLGQDNACNCGLVLTSPDGVTWTRQSNSSANIGQDVDFDCESLAYFSAPVLWDGSKFLTYTYTCQDFFNALPANFIAYTSPDGATWTASKSYAVPANGPVDNAYVSYHPVAATPSGYLITGNEVLGLNSSTDFATWSQTVNLAGPNPPQSSNSGGGALGLGVLTLLGLTALLRRQAS